MKTLLCILTVVCFVSIGCQSEQPTSSANTPFGTPEALAAAYMDAVEAKDGEALAGLTLWEGNIYMKEMQMRMAKSGLEDGLVSSTIGEVSESQKQSYIDGQQRDGKTLVPNLPVSKILTVKTKTDLTIEHPIGFDGKRWWITATVSK